MSSNCNKAILMQVDTAYRRLVIPKMPFNNTIEVLDVTEVSEEIQDELICNVTKYYEYVHEIQSNMLSYENWIATQQSTPPLESVKQYKTTIAMLSVIR
jgi:glutamyl-tRNA reductase